MHCLNCGQAAGPNYCGHCGQSLESHRSPLLALLREGLEEGFSVDGRLWQTLKALPQPGLLTERFLQGKRASLMRPVRLYLLASVALFSTILSLGAPSIDSINLYVGDELMNAPRDASRTDIRIVGENTSLGAFIADRQAASLARLKSLPPQEMLNRLFAGFRSTLPVALIVFVPFLALALKLLYIRTATLYVDHLVFSAHFQAAMFVALIAAWGVTRLLPPGFFSTLLLYALMSALVLFGYLPLALRRVYRQGRLLTAAKTMLLALVYVQLLANVVGLAVILVLLRL
jgi:hypothetical protein